MRVFLHGSAATPVALIRAMQARHREIHHVELVSITTMGDVDFENPEWRDSFFFNSSVRVRQHPWSGQQYARGLCSDLSEPDPAAVQTGNIAAGRSIDPGIAARCPRVLFAGHVCRRCQIGGGYGAACDRADQPADAADARGWFRTRSGYRCDGLA